MPTDETQRTPTPCPHYEARDEVKEGRWRGYAGEGYLIRVGSEIAYLTPERILDQWCLTIVVVPGTRVIYSGHIEPI